MHLSRQFRIFIIFYICVVLILFAILYFNAFKEPSQIVTNFVFSFTSIDLNTLFPIPWNHIWITGVFLSFLPSVFFLTTNNTRSFTLSLTTGVLILLSTIWLASNKGLLAPLLYLEIALAIGIFTAIILKMIFSSSQAEFLRLAFSQFVSEKMLKELLRNPDKLKLQGKEVMLTVMFIDIRGFTTFAEKHPPALVVNRLNDLLDKVTHLILKHNGTVDKYMGDAVMAFWGAPGDDKKQATHSCLAAIEIRDIIETESEFRVGIGISYGHAVVGNMGSSKRFDYTAIGDTVNTAKRIETATKELAETILVTSSVRQKLEEEKAAIGLKDMGEINVKGKTQSIKVYGLARN